MVLKTNNGLILPKCVKEFPCKLIYCTYYFSLHFELFLGVLSKNASVEAAAFTQVCLRNSCKPLPELFGST